MIDIIFILGAVIAFTASNIDNLFMLVFFFSNKNFKNRHVVIGQYIGISSLILISSFGYFFKFIIPASLIGFLGIFPILIGIRELIKLSKHEEITDDELNPNKEYKRSSIFQVALVSFSNGGDNIGIYVPLFASISAYEMGVTFIIFFLMIGLWCFISHSLVNHSILSDKIEKYGHIIFPFVLIAIGLFILTNSL